MSFIDIDSNIKDLATKMKVKEGKIKQSTINGLDESARFAVNQEKTLVGPFSKSGQLLRSITWTRTGAYSRLILPKARHAIWFEKGRGPVVAKRAKALRFIGGGNTLREGGVIFRKSVGPAKGKPFVAPTRRSMSAVFPKIMVKHINDALKS